MPSNYTPILPREDIALVALSLRIDPIHIPLGLAMICGDCDSIYQSQDGCCPSCTSRHGMRLSRVLGASAS